MTDKGKWEALEGMVLLGKEDSERRIKDSTENVIFRHYNLYRLDVLKEVEAWMEELSDRQFDDASEEEQRERERQEQIEARTQDIHIGR